MQAQQVKHGSPEAASATMTSVLQVTRYLGYSSLQDFFPSMAINPNPGCVNRLCRQAQAAYAASGKADVVQTQAAEVRCCWQATLCMHAAGRSTEQMQAEQTGHSADCAQAEALPVLRSQQRMRTMTGASRSALRSSQVYQALQCTSSSRSFRRGCSTPCRWGPAMAVCTLRSCLLCVC